jgi:hypothetical protein
MKCDGTVFEQEIRGVQIQILGFNKGSLNYNRLEKTKTKTTVRIILTSDLASDEAWWYCFWMRSPEFLPRFPASGIG